jgi:hypothetical protein
MPIYLPYHVQVPRTHHREKPDLPQPKQGAELSFAAFGFRRPEQKGWTGLELKPQKLPSDFKTKKRKPAI